MVSILDDALTASINNIPIMNVSGMKPFTTSTNPAMDMIGMMKQSVSFKNKINIRFLEHLNMCLLYEPIIHSSEGKMVFPGSGLPIEVVNTGQETLMPGREIAAVPPLTCGANKINILTHDNMDNEIYPLEIVDLRIFQQELSDFFDANTIVSEFIGELAVADNNTPAAARIDINAPFDCTTVASMINPQISWEFMNTELRNNSIWVRLNEAVVESGVEPGGGIGQAGHILLEILHAHWWPYLNPVRYGNSETRSSALNYFNHNYDIATPTEGLSNVITQINTFNLVNLMTTLKDEFNTTVTAMGQNQQQQGYINPDIPPDNNTAMIESIAEFAKPWTGVKLLPNVMAKRLRLPKLGLIVSAQSMIISPGSRFKMILSPHCSKKTK